MFDLFAFLLMYIKEGLDRGRGTRIRRWKRGGGAEASVEGAGSGGRGGGERGKRGWIGGGESRKIGAES